LRNSGNNKGAEQSGYSLVWSAHASQAHIKI